MKTYLNLKLKAEFEHSRSRNCAPPSPVACVVGPNSPSSTIIQCTKHMRMRLPKWDLIQAKLQEFTAALALRQSPSPDSCSNFDISSLLKTTIKCYNPSTADVAEYELLDQLHLFGAEEELIPVLVFIAETALEFPVLFPQPIPCLTQNMNGNIWLSASQATCILANAFFCTFPSRVRSLELEGRHFPDINFFNLYQNTDQRAMRPKVEKLKCLLHYFDRRRRVGMQTEAEEIETIVSFERKCLPPGAVDWAERVDVIGDLAVFSAGSIETAQGCLQVDFANRLVGGGVLGNGAVMEEIRFAVCPELIVARLFTESLADNEVLLVTGTQQYSAFAGYRQSFKYTGDYADPSQLDTRNRKAVQIVAMDALQFGKSFAHSFGQFARAAVERELNKAYCAFREDEGIQVPSTPTQTLPPVASGNWGCGAFNGNVQLKSLIQLMAATAAKRPLVMYTFGNWAEAEALKAMHSVMVCRATSIGQLLKCFDLYYETFSEQVHDDGQAPELSLFEFLHKVI